MLKLSNVLKSRSAGSGNLLAGKVNNATDTLQRHIFTSQSENRSSQIYADYTIFKGKAALSASPIFPNAEVNSRYGKKGCILLKFWPAIGERKYDWEKRQIFALSPTELGSLISLETGKSCEFFHDPFMKSSNAGQIRKSLSVTPLGDESGYFFTLTVVNNTLKTNERLSVPVNKAEYTVMRTTFSYILPHIMGWNQVAEQIAYPARQQEMRASESAYPTRQHEMGMSPTLEWDR